MMRRDLRFTLLCDGTSDRSLVPILEWSLSQHFLTAEWAIVGSVVDFDRLPLGKVSSLSDRLKTAAEVYPCELLFVHRDAESQTVQHRENEINCARSAVALSERILTIPVIPVRMTEAWLLIDERAIRRAAGFRGGREPLKIPKPSELERRADPKKILMAALHVASGRTGRKLETFNVNEARANVASYIEDFTRLRLLKSFRRLEAGITSAKARLKLGEAT